MKRVAIILLLVGALAAPMVANVATAQQPQPAECRVNRVSASAPPDRVDNVPGVGTVPIDSPVGIYYLEIRANSALVTEIYKETNNLRGLQRGGHADLDGASENPACVDDLTTVDTLTL